MARCGFILWLLDCPKFLRFCRSFSDRALQKSSPLEHRRLRGPPVTVPSGNGEERTTAKIIAII